MSPSGFMGRGESNTSGAKRRCSLVLTFLLLSLSAVSSLAADSPADLLRKGLFEEEANQNLDAAIKAYQAIIEQADEQRKIAGTAIFRLAESYRKLGKTNEAATQYQRVLRDYSEQTNLVSLSQRHLSTLRPPGDLPTDARATTSVVNDPAQAKLVEEEIELVQRQIDATTKQYQNGTATREDVIKLDRELCKLLRKLPSNAHSVAQTEIITKEIKLVEELLGIMRKRIETGRAGPLDDVPIKRELLALQRELAAEKSGQITATATEPAPSTTTEEAEEIRKIRAMVANSPDLLDRPAEQNLTPLQKAAFKGQLHVARYLISAGADVDRATTSRKKSTALHYAADAGHKAIVELLLASKANVNATDAYGAAPLHYATLNGFKAVVEILLANEANIEGVATRQDQVASGPLRVDFRGATPLHLAAENHRTITEMLLNKGANIESLDAEENTPLQRAASAGRREIVELLLKRGAKVNHQSKGGATALHTSMWAKQPEIARMLLAHGADVNAESPPKVFGPIHAALDQEEARMPLTEVLLKHKPNLNARNVIGETPLHRAVALGELKIVEALLRAGADPNATRPQGQTPLFLAAGEPRIVEALLKHGANPNILDDFGNSPLDLIKQERAGGVGGGLRMQLQRTIPQRSIPGRPSGGTADPQIQSSDQLLDSAELLRRAGAIENLSLLAAITLGRREGDIKIPSFRQTTNAPNRFTLLELLANYYVPGTRRPGMPFAAYAREIDLPFPDFRRVTLRKVAPSPTNTIEVLNLLEASGTVDCSKDRWLEWGDIVEVPEADHQINASWSGIIEMQSSSFSECLKRRINLTIAGETTPITLLPQGAFGMQLPGVPAVPPGTTAVSPSRRAHSPGNTELSAGIRRTAAGEAMIASFWATQVLRTTGLLRSSTDLTRVKVKRTDPVTKTVQEIAVNLEGVEPSSANDLWLREGDVIEIPDKE